MSLSRRAFLGTACSAAAYPLTTPVVLAEAPGDNRLVVIVLRGAMDGLDILTPYGDPALTRLRPTLGQRPTTDLDGYFGLGADFGDLLPLWQAGQLAFVPAVSTPYRDRRSHFDGQDMLENGGANPSGGLTPSRDGWLNRALSLIPGARTETAIAVGRGRMMLLDGDAPAGSWSPGQAIGLADQAAGLLARIYHDDPLFAEALAEAEMLGQDRGERGRQTGETLARYTAERLRDRARIAAFSLPGWDTHRRQQVAMRRAAKGLVGALTTLRHDLGPVWDKTAVLTVTEFGRTVRENGTRGTDHGTGGAMVLAGGTIRGGRIYGRWPGLGEGDLHQDRDLMPTDDLRRWAGWAISGMFGLERSAVENTVFPRLDMGADPGFLA